MRMSCNGCRVLRKGCSENCSIRPCLQWIRTPESQANATVFLAKFYGRAGLLNLINAGPEHLRPAIFRSLLYEACGRILNPIYGSVGLLWSGSWQRCQVAVEAVLKGVPITPINSESAVIERGPPLKAYDIRHVSKDRNSSAPSNDAKRVKTRTRFKPKNATKKGTGLRTDEPEEPTAWTGCCTAEKEVADRTTSHESSLSHQSEETTNVAAAAEGESKETESMVSVETANTSILFRDEPESTAKRTNRADNEGGDLALELTLGFEPVSRAPHVVVPVKKRRLEFNQFKDYGGGSAENGLCKIMKLRLEYPASA